MGFHLSSGILLLNIIGNVLSLNHSHHDMQSNETAHLEPMNLNLPHQGEESHNLLPIIMPILLFKLSSGISIYLMHRHKEIYRQILLLHAVGNNENRGPVPVWIWTIQIHMDKIHNIRLIVLMLYKYVQLYMDLIIIPLRTWHNKSVSNTIIYLFILLFYNHS